MTGALEALRAGGRAALSRALSRIEADEGADANVALLDEAFQAPKGIVIGLTGPPGVGKSTLTQALITAFRAEGESVGVIAIDPTSPVTGGALLGDRTRLKTNPGDEGVFVRSFSAGDRLGGLSGATIAASVLMQALFDRVIVETVGVGQSEADIGQVADITVVCVQPGSGDSLQFMKAGIMEVPDIIAVTKADLGAPARRAVADIEGALGLSDRAVSVFAVSAVTGEGVEDLIKALISAGSCSPKVRAEKADLWLYNLVRHRFGTHGLEQLTGGLAPKSADFPFQAMRAAVDKLAN